MYNPDLVGNFTGPAALLNIMSLLNGFRASQALFTAVELGIFDILASGSSMRLEDIHQRCGKDVSLDGLQRLLDACVSLHLLQKQSPGVYSCEAECCRYLSSQSPESLAGYVHHSSRVVWPLFGGLTSAVVTGRNVWQQQMGFQGSEIFSHIYNDEASVLRFMMGMHSFAHLSAPFVVKAFDLSKYRRVVDLGGATGALMYALVEAYPETHAWVVDLPHVISLAQQHFTSPPYVRTQQLLERVHWSAGDFFKQPEALPAADLFVLSRILHDWEEDKCKQLLSTVFNLLPAGGGVLIAEMLLDEDHSGPAPAALQSLNMLAQTNGRERSASDFATLLEQAGFVEVKASRTGSYLDAVLAVKQ